MGDGPTDAHYDFAAKVCGFDPRDGGQSSQPDDASSSSGGDSGAVTSDGAGYSSAAPEATSSQAPPAADDSGGMSSTTSDGAGYSSSGSTPDSSQAPPATDDGNGGMTGVTPDGAPYSAPGTAPESDAAASDSNQPVDPTALDPNQPVDPAALDPNQPVNPAALDPNQPVDPAASDPNQPVDPAALDPNQPVDPAALDPNQPVDPAASDPNQPVDPAASDPNQPVDPAASDPNGSLAAAPVNLAVQGVSETIELQLSPPKATEIWGGKAKVNWKVVAQFTAAFLPGQEGQFQGGYNSKEQAALKIAGKWSLESVMRDIGAPDILTKAKLGGEAKYSDAKGLSVKVGVSISGKYGSGEVNGIVVKKEPGKAAVYGGIEFAYGTPSITLQDYKEDGIEVTKISIVAKASATLEPNYVKLIADELIEDAEMTAAEGGGAGTGASAAAILDVALPAALAVVAVGTIAGVADMFAQRSQNMDMRVGINTAHASLYNGLYDGLAGRQASGNDELYKKTYDIGRQAYTTAYAKVMDQPSPPPPDEVAEAAAAAAKKAAASWNGVAKMDNEIRWAFFRRWVENNAGLGTFQGAAQDAVLSCFGIAKEPITGEHMRYWASKSSLPDVMKS